MIKFIKKILGISNDSEIAYKKAKEIMHDMLKKINTNIPDYAPDELPIHRIYVKYPKKSLDYGEVSQITLLKRKDMVILGLKYKNNGALKKHTHYGWWEYVYVKNGVFTDLKGNQYVKGDGFLVDGYEPHRLANVSETGEALILLSKYKENAKFTNLKKYI